MRNNMISEDNLSNASSKGLADFDSCISVDNNGIIKEDVLILFEKFYSNYLVNFLSFSKK